LAISDEGDSFSIKHEGTPWMKTCHACDEPISPTLIVCPHCGTQVRSSSRRVSKKSARAPSKSATKMILIVVASLSGVVLVSGIFLAILQSPAVDRSPETAGPVHQAAQPSDRQARRSPCRNNLRQIAVALHMYHQANNSLPPAYVADENGKRMHSWRVLILPQLGQNDLYSRYNFSEPWDGPNNSRLMASRPPVYACSEHSGDSVGTAYLAISGEHSALAGPNRVNFRDFPDGLANTIMVVKASHAAVPWMKPDDLDPATITTIGNPPGFASDHPGGLHATFVDGAVRFLSQDIPPKTLQALFTRNGGEVIDGF
jgi:hypothetical protein